MNYDVYKPTARGLEDGSLEKTDRLIFVNRYSAVVYNWVTREIKSVDRHLLRRLTRCEVTAEPLPDTLLMSAQAYDKLDPNIVASLPFSIAVTHIKGKVKRSFTCYFLLDAEGLFSGFDLSGNPVFAPVLSNSSKVVMFTNLDELQVTKQILLSKGVKASIKLFKYPLSM